MMINGMLSAAYPVSSSLPPYISAAKSSNCIAQHKIAKLMVTIMPVFGSVKPWPEKIGVVLVKAQGNRVRMSRKKSLDLSK